MAFQLWPFCQCAHSMKGSIHQLRARRQSARLLFQVCAQVRSIIHPRIDEMLVNLVSEKINANRCVCTCAAEARNLLPAQGAINCKPNCCRRTSGEPSQIVSALKIAKLRHQALRWRPCSGIAAERSTPVGQQQPAQTTRCKCKILSRIGITV